MKLDAYIEVLDDNPQYDVYGLDQHDNISNVISKSVTSWLQQKTIAVLPWSSISPDLNPIENLWSELKIRIGHWNLKNLQELEKILVREEYFSANMRESSKSL